jgi:hypothetical protein
MPGEIFDKPDERNIHISGLCALEEEIMGGIDYYGAGNNPQGQMKIVKPS